VERRAGAVVGLRNGPDGLFYAEMDHHELCARTVLLATGVRENMPPLEHVAEAVRRGVVRLCPICDGYESSGLKVAVIGAGRHAAREALFLRTWAPQVTLLLQDEDLPDTTRSALAEAAVEVLPVGLGRVKIEAGRVSAEVSGQGPPRRFDVIYSAFGATPERPRWPQRRSTTALRPATPDGLLRPRQRL
jgi:thioredoxin reductase (NADPH)